MLVVWMPTHTVPVCVGVGKIQMPDKSQDLKRGFAYIALPWPLSSREGKIYEIPSPLVGEG